MSKKTTEQTPTTQEQTQEPTQPKPQSKELEKLLSDGKLMLTAKSREEINAQALAIIAEADGCHIGAGCVCHDVSNAIFTLQLEIIK